jgi:hypothetical protein
MKYPELKSLYLRNKEDKIMSYDDHIECPYCLEDNLLSKILEDRDHAESFDVECTFCQKEFEITVEYEPSYMSHKIEYEKCEHCGDEVRYSLRNRKNSFPFPDVFGEKEVCRKCCEKAIMESYKEDENESFLYEKGVESKKGTRLYSLPKNNKKR